MFSLLACFCYFLTQNVTDDSPDRDIALELFPNITGRRRDSMDEFSCCSHEKQVDDLKASLKKSQEKNAKLQVQATRYLLVFKMATCVFVNLLFWFKL